MIRQRHAIDSLLGGFAMVLRRTLSLSGRRVLTAADVSGGAVQMILPVGPPARRAKIIPFPHAEDEPYTERQERPFVVPRRPLFPAKVPDPEALLSPRIGLR